MKKFSFSFQYLLDVHLAKEQAAQFELQQAVSTQAKIEYTMKTLAETRHHHIQEVEKTQGVVKREAYTAHLATIDRIDLKYAEQKHEQYKQAEVIKACRTALLKEETARRILENLFDRERNEWAEALQIEEQKQMDELAVMRWSRQESRA